MLVATKYSAFQVFDRELIQALRWEKATEGKPRLHAQARDKLVMICRLFTAFLNEVKGQGRSTHSLRLIECGAILEFYRRYSRGLDIKHISKLFDTAQEFWRSFDPCDIYTAPQ